ncbi:phycobilisome linker polypeptide [Oculatella sp. LEGE 06141]|uniref:phycobilisome linker polypeptide n=1 Tax=Oculatella sp. LEGE 06141 TaxID=1828648 RepID=UPI0018822E5D|nr:phycobilisome linker polypeptide [Oculatella sp. LEGE 06141]MBE9182139.1 phycobilisome linker polypeptide [Oculatella sp. LEGE 06141]
MFGQGSQGSASFSDTATRMYRFEVRGLRQTYQSDKLSYPIRRSGNAVITVPYNRMNEEMQRIGRLGGTIVSIEPVTGDTGANSGAKRDAAVAHQDAKAAHNATKESSKEKESAKESA